VPDGSGSQRGHFELGEGDAVENVVPVCGKDAAGWCEYHAAPLALRDLDAEFPFERGKLHGDAGSSQVEFVGHGGDRAEPLKFGEHPKLSNVDHECPL
jgi:hypothetical protein